jgi:hypothetical protein
MVNAVQSPISHPIELPCSKNLCEDSNAFITYWKTDNTGVSNSDQITIPTGVNGSYNCRVDWGDNTSDYITAYDDPKWTHTYPAAGEYEVRIEGLFNVMRFAFSGDRLKLLEVRQWGDYKYDVINSQFFGCASLTVPATDKYVLAVGGLFRQFRGCGSIVKFPSMTISNMEIATGLNETFYNCSSMTEDFGEWRFGKNVTVNNTFRFCTSLDFSMANWNAEYITNGVNFLANGGELSTANYSETLIAWEQLDLYDGVAIHFGTSTYNASGAIAKAAIIADDSWGFTDGGLA